MRPPGPIADLIYVHAKVAVIDDRILIVGSANLNDHSMFNDTEAALVTDDADLAAGTRRRLWAEHLECGEDDVRGDPTDLDRSPLAARAPRTSSSAAGRDCR